MRGARGARSGPVPRAHRERAESTRSGLQVHGGAPGPAGVRALGPVGESLQEGGVPPDHQDVVGGEEVEIGRASCRERV